MPEGFDDGLQVLGRDGGIRDTIDLDQGTALRDQEVIDHGSPSPWTASDRRRELTG